MRLTHFHVGVQDLNAARGWFKQIADQEPSLVAPGKLCFEMEGVTLVFDESAQDIPVTLAIKTPQIDAAYAELLGRGAESLEAPNDKRWGVRSAYLKGPGAVTLELEKDLGGHA